MTEFDEYINDLKGRLPLPSEQKGEICVPYQIDGYDYENGCPTFSQIVFEKEYHEGICIGWKLKT